MELLLDSPRGLSWIDNAARGLRLPDALRPLLRGRIRLLLMRGARVAFDLTVNSFDNRVLEALDSLTPDIWVCVFKDSTSPLPILLGLSHDVLDRCIGQVGSIAIPDFVWDMLAPSDFSLVASRDVRSMRQMSAEGLTMARALVRDGVLSLWEGGGKPNGYLFPVPKNSSKASMIVHLVRFNKEHAFKPTSFNLPIVEDLAFLIQVHNMLLPELSLGGGDYLKFLSDPFLMTLEDLKIAAGPREELFACHVDLTNAFWSLR